MTIVGRIQPASNLAVLVSLESSDGEVSAIYKPIEGEAPLWDFPDGTLAAREVAAHLISAAGGFDLIPPTVLRDGPMGTGSVQAWIGQPGEPLGSVVDVVPAGRIPPGWLEVLQAQDASGRELAVVHEDAADLRSMALLDAVLNNADRKGSHLGRDGDGRLWGFDHGLTGHRQEKLRTILWGWQGEPLDSGERDRLERLEGALQTDLGEALGGLLTAAEVTALGARVRDLLTAGRFPLVPDDRYGIPWPPL